MTSTQLHLYLLDLGYEGLAKPSPRLNAGRLCCSRFVVVSKPADVTLCYQIRVSTDDDTGPRKDEFTTPSLHSIGKVFSIPKSSASSSGRLCVSTIEQTLLADIVCPSAADAVVKSYRHSIATEATHKAVFVLAKRRNLVRGSSTLAL